MFRQDVWIQSELARFVRRCVTAKQSLTITHRAHPAERHLQNANDKRQGCRIGTGCMPFMKCVPETIRKPYIRKTRQESPGMKSSVTSTKKGGQKHAVQQG